VQSPPAITPQRVPPRRVLVVDDNADLRATLQSVLEAEGHAVQVAATGMQALEMATAQRPDLIILDIGLPDMDGNDVARELCRRLAGECPPMVAVTGWGQEADRRRSSQAGFARHLTKPVDPIALREVMAALG
jgi:CheY-like chemotaxis protein